jgi:hypothetical protein
MNNLRRNFPNLHNRLLNPHLLHRHLQRPQLLIISPKRQIKSMLCVTRVYMNGVGGVGILRHGVLTKNTKILCYIFFKLRLWIFNFLLSLFICFCPIKPNTSLPFIFPGFILDRLINKIF